MAWFIHGTSMQPQWCPQFNKIDKSPEFKYPGLDTGRPLTEKTIPPSISVPKTYKLQSARKRMPDFFYATSELCCNEKTKILIESFEPETHQFFPVTLLGVKNEIMDGRFFLINICNGLDSIIVEKSNITTKHKQRGSNLSGKDFMTVKSELIHGKHIWRETGLKAPSGYIFFSDEMHKSFVSEDIKKIDHWNKAYEY